MNVAMESAHCERERNSCKDWVQRFIESLDERDKRQSIVSVMLRLQVLFCDAQKLYNWQIIGWDIACIDVCGFLVQ